MDHQSDDIYKKNKILIVRNILHNYFIGNKLIEAQQGTEDDQFSIISFYLTSDVDGYKKFIKFLEDNFSYVLKNFNVELIDKIIPAA